MQFDTVIGLEVHAQLATQSKLFSGSSTRFAAMPNTQTSFIDAGLPGTLPVLNQQAVMHALQFGLAIDANINLLSYFERKNYMYPDLPKGYQISQYQCPIVGPGKLDIILPNHHTKTVFIERAHLEEDAGKLIHHPALNQTAIDLNRAGMPLLEIVTTPCLYSADEAVTYLKTLQQLLRFLKICDGNMQEGSFRCDVNLSLKPIHSQTLGTRVELKNLNSFKFIEKAIVYEQKRQSSKLAKGELIVQETRAFSPDTNQTISLRQKEHAHDYRYFPDPDLPSIVITSTMLNQAKKALLPLPRAIKQKLLAYPDLNEADLDFLLAQPEHYEFFQQVQTYTQASVKMIVNWLKGNLLSLLKEHGLNFKSIPIDAATFGKLLNFLHEKTYTPTAIKKILANLIIKPDSLDALLTSEKPQTTLNPEALIVQIKQLIDSHPQQVQDYRQGKTKLLAFFIGQMMQQTQGQVDPKTLKQLLLQQLNA